MTRINVGTVESVRFSGSEKRERPDGPAFEGAGDAAATASPFAAGLVAERRTAQSGRLHGGTGK
ncbi:hypothetical protein GIY62_16465 [Burkholderia plantarii]|uniref:hypothetical protein n=1 Tax=Burkholderia plantarii TaxID=41899 RepID=UPI00272BE072|nr:hypothetical protein [Burkholderia plantarii]WLE58695.1 hypothetical protein GIY62_16465 [Burkholderia plantarii]